MAKDSKQILLKGIVGSDGLYKFQPFDFTHNLDTNSNSQSSPVSSLHQSASPMSSQISVFNKAVHCNNALSNRNIDSTFYTWHLRLGHAHSKAVETVLKWCNIPYSNKSAIIPCVSCAVPLPPHKKAIGCKWIFRVKENPDGSVNKYKARLVAKGFLQTPGFDFTETFSPVIKPVTVRIILTLAVTYRWSVQQIDINNAFLNGLLQEEVYMSQPAGFEASDKKLVCKLHKSLYGLKQAPRAWYERLTQTLLQMGFVKSKCDPSLLVHHQHGACTYVLVYVDDILIIGSDSQLVKDLIHKLNIKFALKQLGEVDYFLGIEVHHKPSGGLLLHQSKYVKDLLVKTNMENCKPIGSPMVSSYKLSKFGTDVMTNPTLYRSTVGTLQYATLTRPDISYSVNKVCQFMAHPLESHWKAVKRILRYLKGTLNYGLLLQPSPSSPPFSLRAYSDADWATDQDDRRSTSGSCIYFGSNLVSWGSKKQQLVARSSTEAEYRNWLDTIPAGTIETWRQLERKFLDRYFPIHKFLERRAEISNFEQADGETLYDAWERFKVCLKRCPNHGFDGHNQMQMFTQGLRAQTRMILDASAGGSLKNRDETEARELVESMAQNEYRATNDRGAKKKGGVLELDTQTALLAQQKLMTSQMEAMMKLLSNPQVQTSPIGKIDNVRCDFCLQDHPNGGCFPEGSEEARYLANFRKPYNNNNNGSGWGNGGFGGNTHDNPKNETCNGITLRSREIPERPAVEKPLQKKVIEGEVENKQEVVVENERYEGEVEKETMLKEVEISEDEKEEVEKQREIKEKESKKGKKKSDANPTQEPPKKPRTKMSASKGQSSRSAQASPPRRSHVTRPQVHPHFISEVHEKRYSQIRTFTINQEKGFGEDLLKGVAELGNEIKSRGWEKFNKLMIKDEVNPGNQMWAREFFANAYLPDQPMFPEYVSVVRGVKVSYSFETINNLLGCAAGGVCELLRDRERIDKSGIEVREELKNIVCRPGAMWLAHSAASLPRRLSLTSFNPVHRAWGEFWLKNVRVVGNNSEIQLDNAHAVRLLVEGKFINLGYWLQKDLHEIANHPNPTFTLGHCNLIAALCRANNVPMNVQEGDLHPVRPLSLSYFIKKFERGHIVPRGEGNVAREEALREEEEINRFEEGNHPDQQGEPAYESQEIPGHAPPRYSHDMNQLASMLHQMEISQYFGLPNLYFDTASSMYTEAMAYRSTFPPPTFGTLYPVDTDWEAHQARELTSFQARQAYNSGLRTSELAEIERRRRVEQDEAAAMEREMLDVDGLNLNLNSPFTNYFTGHSDDAV
ncbi:unnamed protein product [Trifolium pratense]|uniref:Uncharacterized protein n=1 Tax=Trifolium pratense TaxID=57577 RepID=A0ACB0JEW9_TRIPR|nr:unnamed protein product [Trifolium pratense]